MRNFLKITSFLTFSNLITRILGMLFFLFLARGLSVSDYGLFRYLISLSMILSISYTGFPTALTKFIGDQKNKNSKIIHAYTYNTLVIISGIFIILCMIVLFFFENKLFLILFIFAALIDFFYIGFVRGKLNYVKLIGYKLLENLLQLLIIIIIFFLIKKVDFRLAVIIYAITPILAAIIFEIYKFELNLKNYFSIEIIKRLIKFALPVTIGSLGWITLFGINVIFIKIFYSTIEVGFYSVAETIVQIFTFLPFAVATLLMPKIANMKNKNKVVKPLIKSIKLIVITSIILITFLHFFGYLLIQFFFSEKYLNSVQILIPLGIAQIFISIFNIFASVYQGLNMPKEPAKIIILAAICNILLSYFLTLNFGIFGSSISIMISGLFALIYIIIKFYKTKKIILK